MSTTQKILDILESEPEYGFRASYLAEKVNTHPKYIGGHLSHHIKKGRVEILPVSKKEVYYISHEGKR